MGLFEDLKEKYKKSKQDKQELEDIKRQAKKQAMIELKEELVKTYKEEEITKIKKKASGGNWAEKLAKEFQGAGDSIFSKDKIDKVISSNTNQNANVGMFSEDRLNRMLEGTPGQTKTKSKQEEEEERLKKFLE